MNIERLILLYTNNIRIIRNNSESEMLVHDGKWCSPVASVTAFCGYLLKYYKCIQMLIIKALDIHSWRSHLMSRKSQTVSSYPSHALTPGHGSLHTWPNAPRPMLFLVRAACAIIKIQFLHTSFLVVLSFWWAIPHYMLSYVKLPAQIPHS